MAVFESASEQQALLPLQVRYEQMCNDIRFTDEISLKLLGLIPLVSGAGILTVLFAGPDRSSGDAALLGGFVGLLGAIVTFAIYRWEVRNLNFCRYLREQVAYLEQHMALDDQHGHFLGRPRAPAIWPLRTRRKEASEVGWVGASETRRMGKTEAERILYTSVILSWLALPGIAALLA